MRLRVFWKRAAVDLAEQVAVLREELRQTALDRDAARGAAYAIQAESNLWKQRAGAAERAEAQLVERLARLAEQQTPGIVATAGQCRWVGLATGERCGLRDGHHGLCVDSAGRYPPGAFTATRLGEAARP